MKTKHLLSAATALLLLGGFWFAHSTQRERQPRDSGEPRRARLSGPADGADFNGQAGGRTPDRPLLPPNPNRAFEELTPEQRVQRARNPHGVGG